MRERLQKLIASAGIASRRHAEELITSGHVTINGEQVTELGYKADAEIDHIKVRGRLINPLLKKRKNIYILLNKPKGYLTSLHDPPGRPLVTELIPPALGRLHPIGRLDFNSEGLLLLTNDGEFTNLITSAKNHIPKVYQVKVKGVPSESSVGRLRRGISIDKGEWTAPAEVRPLRAAKANSWFEVVLYEGRNQQIRRMFDAVGHSVLKLKRIRIGKLVDKGLAPGRWRTLAENEIRSFRAFVSAHDSLAASRVTNPRAKSFHPTRKKNRRREKRF
jgi:23S rRNA pseudouridine2605 synthase